MRNILLLLITIVILTSCNSQQLESSNEEKETFIIWTTNCGLTNTNLNEEISDFGRSNEKILDIRFFDDSFDLNMELKSDSTTLKPDFIIGFTNVDPWIINNDSLFISYPQEISDGVLKQFKHNNRMLIPLYYHDLAFIFNRDEIEDIPDTFGRMQDGYWKDKLIMPDPEKTSLGRAMLIWSIAAFGKNGYSHFWKSIKENIYRIEEKWDDAYRQFLAQEAPIVLGFSTIPRYHEKKGDRNNIGAFIPQEGGFRLISYAAVTTGCSDEGFAKELIKHLLLKSTQAKLDKLNLGNPVIDISSSAESSVSTPVAERYYNGKITTETIEKNFDIWLKRWKKIMK